MMMMMMMMIEEGLDGLSCLMISRDL